MKQAIPWSWLDPRIEIRASPIAGRGLFARSAIAMSDVIARWGGVPITDAELADVAAREARYNSAAIGEGMNLLLALDDPVGLGNHSCDPNLWMGDATTVIARRDIMPNEELTIDYATHTVSAGWRMESDCHCGSPLCRHVIAGNDWRRPELQERYAGHFSPFINSRIQNHAVASTTTDPATTSCKARRLAR